MGVIFNYKLFHMSNIKGQNLIPRYEVFMILTRRENMNTFWGEEPSTVRGKLGYLIIMIIYEL